MTGRGPRHPATTTITAPPAAESLTLLRSLVELRDRGLCEPLPMAAQASAAYAQARDGGDGTDQAEEAADRVWTKDLGGEQQDAFHELVWGARPDLRLLLAERGQREPSRFGDLAVALWRPLLRSED